MEITINNAKVYFDTRTTEEWAKETRVIPEGFLCIEKADGGDIKLKAGDGEHTYEQLPYANAGADLDNYYNKGEIDEKFDDCVHKDDVLILNCSLPEE